MAGIGLKSDLDALGRNDDNGPVFTLELPIHGNDSLCL